MEHDFDYLTKKALDASEASLRKIKRVLDHHNDINEDEKEDAIEMADEAVYYCDLVKNFDYKNNNKI